MPRFALLLHEFPRGHARTSHCDLVLDTGDSLRTWALQQLPRDWGQLDTKLAVGATNTVDAEQLPDHRIDYLDYEGPVSGDRGHVRRIEAGTFTMQHESRDGLEATLNGQSLRGEISFRRSSSSDSLWQLTFVPKSVAP